MRLETVLVSMQDRCTVCANVQYVQKLFWTHPMEHLGGMGQVESHFGHLEIVLVSVQDRCKVCAKCTIGSEIVLNTPDGTPR